MAVQELTQNELVLNQSQFAYILDRTKGIINCLVGPTKQQIANTEQPVRFNRQTRKFDFCSLGESIQDQVTADEGSYIILEGTTRDSTPPPTGANGVSGAVGKVDAGRKIMVPGPTSFPLWPGQVATVVPGHHLKTNEYLICRVYNDTEAKSNWSKAIMRKRKIDDQGQGKPTASPAPVVTGSPKDGAQASADAASDFVMGQVLIIKGTDVAYFVPPTGIEVLSESGKPDYMRSAVTLEKLDYCILLSESGHKRYVQGPAVVFPEPTEGFYTKDDDDGKTVRKFKAYELNENMGIHIKVIESYTDETGEHKEGEELFVTGNTQPIYFPRKEHSIIRYGDRDIQYAIAIPAGEARYVLDKRTGKVDMARGPKMFLPDPRGQVVVRKILSAKDCELYYPGNAEALAINGALQAAFGPKGSQGTQGVLGADSPMMFTQHAALDLLGSASNFELCREVATAAPSMKMYSREVAGKAAVADEMYRHQTFTPPRTVTLNTKYDGAVTINVWNGFAVLVVGSDGQRRVEKGPVKLLLGYDEQLEPQQFSTGKPKTTDNLLRTPYLKYQHNQVSDIVPVTTKDLVKVSLKVSYRVNFEGDATLWFAVDNYVKFLCDRMRSMLNNAVKRIGIEEFMANTHDIVRNTVLGEKKEGQTREGRLFPENGMRIYDIELLTVHVGDSVSGVSGSSSPAGTDIIAQLTQAQHATITRLIRIKDKEAELTTTQREEHIKQEIEFARQDTQDKITELQARSEDKKLNLKRTQQNAAATLESERLDIEVNKQSKFDEIQGSELGRQLKASTSALNLQREQLAIEKSRLEAETGAFVAKASVVSDKLVTALNTLGDKNLAIEIAKSTAPLAYLRGNSAADAFSQLIHGLPFVSEIAAKLGKLPVSEAARKIETAIGK